MREVEQKGYSACLWFAALAFPLSAHMELACLPLPAYACMQMAVPVRSSTLSPSLSLSPFKVAWQRPPSPLPSLSSTSQPTSDSHAISCMCSGACVLSERACLHDMQEMAGTGFVQMLAYSWKGGVLFKLSSDKFEFPLCVLHHFISYVAVVLLFYTVAHLS